MSVVVWKGPQRWAVLAIAAVAAGAVAVPPANAAEVTAPGSVKVVGTMWGDTPANTSALRSYGTNDAMRDAGSLYTITQAIGARAVWNTEDSTGRAVTGRGVTVAIADSGVAAVPGLDTPGKIVRGPDLSLESNSDVYLGDDTFGHGTHIAGIIAAKDPVVRDARTGAPKATRPTDQLGVAPDAQLLPLKLASTDGSADVSQIIAGLDWIAQHRTDGGTNVRVVNLAFGTASVQPYEVDPLAAAAENAWRSGIVVVVSGGNGGTSAEGLTDPAIDPYVIAVGSSDPQGQVNGWTKNPTVADYSSRGNAARHVDLLAPGRSVVSLRAPGSFVDVNNPSGLVAGDAASRLFRGSGTSQASAVVSGAAALLLQAYPQLTPDQVKAALVSTATPMPGVDALSGGSGQVNVLAAQSAVAKALLDPHPSGTLLGSAQNFPVATGTGSLEQARAGAHLVDPDSGAVLTGEVDVQGVPWDAPAWSVASANGTSWSGGIWNGARWSGDGWTSTGWARARWSGSSWTRARWSDVLWDRARWSRARWSDDSWARARWSATAWS